MNVAITGAKGTGKSSLLHALEAALSTSLDPSTVEFVTSPGSIAKSLGFSLGKHGSDETHLFFANMHLSNIETESTKLVVQDRCFIDHLAYVRLLSSNGTLISLMEQISRLVSRYYEMLFVTQLQSALPPLSDPSEDEEFRIAIETEILRIAKEYRIPHHLLSGTIESNCDAVAHQIKSVF